MLRQLAAHAGAGQTYQQAALALGLSHATVRNAAVRNGIQFRPRPSLTSVAVSLRLAEAARIQRARALERAHEALAAEIAIARREARA